MNWAQDEHHQFKDHSNDSYIFTRRVLISMLLVLAVFGGLIFRFYLLQVTYHQDYLLLSDQNRIQVRPKPPNRGLVFDRHGELLAENRPTFTLSIVKEHVDDLDRTLERIAELINISDIDWANFDKALKQRRRPFQAIPLRYKLTEEEIALIAVNKYELKGVKVDAQLVRHYPYGPLFAHTLGYVGRINDRELKKFTEQDYSRYAGTHSIGKIGLEKYYEKQLLGQVGNEFIETNAHGRVLDVIRTEPPVAGQNLTLHLDRRVQQAAKEALNDQRGAIVAIDVNTGGVISILSTPSYDPNLFVTGISYKNYKELNESLDLPLFNRTIQGQYPPGSTLKPMLGLGGLEKGIVTFNTSMADPGYYQLENDDRLYREWKRGGHDDPVDLNKAIIESCDIYFYDLAFKMGVDKMHEFGSHFGLGQRSNIDVPSERSGIWPSRAWKRRVRGLGWYPGNSLNMSIGQGDVLATPLQLAVMTASLATEGKRYRPHLVKKLGEKEILPELVEEFQVNKVNWDYIKLAMERVVHSSKGTARKMAKNATYRMAGKTGTAQVVGIAQDEKYDRNKVAERFRDHGLFIGYAPAEQPEIAVAVILENGEHGSTAAPLARAVFDAYFESQRELAIKQNEALGYQTNGVAQ